MVLDFMDELTYLEKAAAGKYILYVCTWKHVERKAMQCREWLITSAAHTVSLQLLGVDIRQMSKGLKEATKELVENKQNKKLKVNLK